VVVSEIHPSRPGGLWRQILWHYLNTMQCNAKKQWSLFVSVLLSALSVIQQLSTVVDSYIYIILLSYYVYDCTISYH
jgi:hypothetical protein